MPKTAEKNVRVFCEPVAAMTAAFALLSTAIDVPVYVVLALDTVSLCHWTLPSPAQ